jgi:hypothetical protein
MIEPAVGINEYDVVRRLFRQLFDGKAERITFASLLWIRTDQNRRASARRNLSRIVRAVIGDNNQSIVGTKLQANVGQRRQQIVPFVMRRHDNRERRSAQGWALQVAPGQQGGNDLDRQHGDRNSHRKSDEDQKQLRDMQQNGHGVDARLGRS